MTEFAHPQDEIGDSDSSFFRIGTGIYKIDSVPVPMRDDNAGSEHPSFVVRAPGALAHIEASAPTVQEAIEKWRIVFHERFQELRKKFWSQMSDSERSEWGDLLDYCSFHDLASNRQGQVDTNFLHKIVAIDGPNITLGDIHEERTITFDRFPELLKDRGLIVGGFLRCNMTVDIQTGNIIKLHSAAVETLERSDIRLADIAIGPSDPLE